VEGECARAEATGGTFSVARVRAAVWTRASDGRGERRRPARPSIDVVGLFGPRARYELLLPALAGGHRARLAAAFAQRGCGGGPAPRVGVASYPDDGRHAAALLARAARARAAKAAGHQPPTLVLACADENMRGAGLPNAPRRRDQRADPLGETGVGKEVLARAIHARRRAPRGRHGASTARRCRSPLLRASCSGHGGRVHGRAAGQAGLLETAPGGHGVPRRGGRAAAAPAAKLLARHRDA
jgi:hypothetical protein